MNITSSITTIEAELPVNELQSMLRKNGYLTETQKLTRVKAEKPGILNLTISEDHALAQTQPSNFKRHFTEEIENILKEKTLDDLNLSVRAFNCISAARITTVRELVEYSAEELRAKRNFGQKSVSEIEQALKELGVTLAD